MAREQLSKFNVVATYSDMGAARKAFDALEAAGVDGDDMSLLGPHAAGAHGRAFSDCTGFATKPFAPARLKHRYAAARRSN